MKVYFEPSALQYIIDKENIREFIEKLNLNKIEFCIGLECIYEFERNFTRNNIDTGVKNFKFLNEMNVKYFINDTEKIIISDSFKYKKRNKGEKLYPFLSGNDKNVVVDEIISLANGKYDDVKMIIEEHDKKRNESIEKTIDEIIKGNKHLSIPKDFEEIMTDMYYRREVIKQSMYNDIFSDISDVDLFSDQQMYPFINTFINVVLYFEFKVLKYKEVSKKQSDYLHLIDANAADCIVTRDEGIQNISRKLCPFLKVDNWEAFKRNVLKW